MIRNSCIDFAPNFVGFRENLASNCIGFGAEMPLQYWKTIGIIRKPIMVY